MNTLLNAQRSLSLYPPTLAATAACSQAKGSGIGTVDRRGAVSRRASGKLLSAGATAVPTGTTTVTSAAAASPTAAAATAFVTARPTAV